MEEKAKTNVHRLLARQLRKSGHRNTESLPSDDQWAAILKRLSAHYEHVEADRVMLAQSLDTATTEMQEMTDQLRGEHARLHQVITAISGSLRDMRKVSGQQINESTIGGMTSAIAVAKDHFKSQVHDILDQAGSGEDPHSDVISSIGRDFVGLTDQIRALLEIGASSSSARRELSLAAEVQKLLLPERDTMERPSANIAVHNQQSSGCGGDWWSVMDLSGGRVMMVIGDVTGHGMASAILTGTAKAAHDLALKVYGPTMLGSQLLSMMNTAIRSAAKQRYLMTVAVVILDPGDNSVDIFNAGHAPLLLIRGSGQHSQVHPIVAHGPPLGAVEEPAYGAQRFAIESGDVLVLYTDGVVERENSHGEQFGDRRLHAVLRHASRWEPVGIRDALLHAVQRHAGDTPPDDDVTFMIARAR